jgi:hypothetical protein
LIAIDCREIDKYTVVEGDYYRKLAKERTVKNFVIPANKGNIFGRRQISNFNS